MKTLAIYFSIILFSSTAVFGQNPKLTGFNNYTKWIDKLNDNKVYAKELLNLDEFVLNDKGTFSFLVMIPPPESFWSWRKEIPSQNFIIEAKDNNTGKEWKVYESFCDRGKISWFEMKPISGNITLTCTYIESDITRSLTYNYKPEYKEVDQHLNYYLSKEQIQALSKLNEDKIQAYKNSKSVSLVVVQNYAQLVNIDLPFRKIAERLLKYTGLEIVNDRSSSFDLQIIINVNGTSIRGVSKIKDSRGHFTEVTTYPEVGFNGNIIFRSVNKAYYSNAFTCKKKFYPLVFTKEGFRTIHSWNQITYGYKDMLYNGSFFKVFGEMLINAFELNPVDFYLYASTDENETISCKAIKLLGELHDARAYNPLVELYERESERKKEVALNALIEMHDLRIIDFLMEVLGEKDLQIRRTAANALFNALVEMHDPRAFNVLINALDDPTICMYSITALAKLDDQRAVEPLLLALNDMSYSYGMVKNAVQTLGSLGDAIAVEPLIHSIDRVNNNKLWKVKERRIVINTIIEVLGDFGDPKAIEYIIPLLKINNLKTNAQKALTQLTGENIGDKYNDWLNWWKEHKSEYLHE
jgi:HEAT repeat protein